MEDKVAKKLVAVEVRDKFVVRGHNVVGLSLSELSDLLHSEPTVSQQAGTYLASFSGGLEVRLHKGWIVDAVTLRHQ